MYIRTENGEAINFSDYKDVNVKPGEDSPWQLIVTNAAGSTEICIAAFDKVDDANRALESLSEAIENDKAWDAKGFKSSLKPSSGTHFTVARGRRGRF